ncbi:MAG TPA: hypothetical protein VK206_23900 [Anaerolineales bacterium]|nr:hypothetical protein [Anaerolineales bacterium]
MTKLDSIPPSLTSFTPSLSLLEPAQRLIVLVPDLEWDYIPAIHRIWELANSQPVRVLFISLCKDPKQELSLRRALVILYAMVQDGKIPVETNVEIGLNWVDVVKRNYEMGDTVVCFAEQRVGLLHKPLSQILHSNLKIPVYILSGIYRQNSDWLSQVIVWSGFIGISIGFYMLQVKIVQIQTDWFQNILLIFSIIPELWLIWAWNNLFS